jgi:bacterial/archaeal transporter family-2 protein
MAWLAAILAIVVGCLNTIQAGANTTLGKGLGQPILAALIVSAVNAVGYIAASLFVGIGLPDSGKVAALPWWAWIGGLLGASYVLAMVLFAEKLGAAVFTGLTVTAGLTTSVVLDHFGLVGFQQHSAGVWRIVGAMLMVGGVALISLT